jgi:hypothetical protein
MPKPYTLNPKPGRSAAFGGAVLSPDQAVQYMTYADDTQTPNPTFPGDYCKEI